MRNSFVEECLNCINFNMVSPTTSCLLSSSAAAEGVHSQPDNLQTRKKKGQDQEETIRK